MKKLIQRFLEKPDAMHLAVLELADAKRERLKAQTGRDYADAMVRYHEARIKRLEEYIGVEK